MEDELDTANTTVATTATSAGSTPPWPKSSKAHLHISYGLSVLALLGFGLWYGVAVWHAVRQATLMRFSLFSAFIARATDATLEHYRGGLELLGQELLRAQALQHPRHARRILLGFRTSYPALASVNLIRLDGRVVASTAVPQNRVPPDFHFVPSLWPGLQRAQRQRGLTVAHPIYGPLIHHWVIPLRYAVRAASGKPRFLLTVPLRLRDQQALWHGLPLGRAPFKGLVIELIRDDGYLVGRWPALKRLDPARLYGRPLTGSLVRTLRVYSPATRGYLPGNHLWRSRGALRCLSSARALPSGRVRVGAAARGGRPLVAAHPHTVRSDLSDDRHQRRILSVDTGPGASRRCKASRHGGRAGAPGSP